MFQGGKQIQFQVVISNKNTEKYLIFEWIESSYVIMLKFVFRNKNMVTWSNLIYKNLYLFD